MQKTPEMQHFEDDDPAAAVAPHRVSRITPRMTPEARSRSATYASQWGGLGIYATLTQVHDRLLELVEDAIDAPLRRDRGAALGALEVELSAHAFAIKKSLYAALLHFESTHDEALRAIAEQNELERLLSELIAQPEGRARTSVLLGLRDELLGHVEWVEGELFVAAHTWLPRLQEQYLGERYGVLKGESKRSLSPERSHAKNTLRLVPQG